MSPINPLKRSIRIALIQLAAGTSKSKNVERASEKVREAARSGASLVVLPECFNSPYGTKYFKQYAESIPVSMLRQLSTTAVLPTGLQSNPDSNPDDDRDSLSKSEAPTITALSKLASETKTYLVGGSIPEREPSSGKLFNTSLTFDPTGQLVALHRKVHLFDIDIPDGITFRESDALSAGTQLTTVEIPEVGHIGIGICYDIRFPETCMIPSRPTSTSSTATGPDKIHHNGVFALIFPAAFNTTTGPMHWQLLARARAVDNEVFVALCSPARDLTADYHAYGHSLVVGPDGMVAHEAGEAETIVYANLEPTAIEKVRQNIPVTLQRRFDVYPNVAG